MVFRNPIGNGKFEQNANRQSSRSNTLSSYAASLVKWAILLKFQDLSLSRLQAPSQQHCHLLVCTFHRCIIISAFFAAIHFLVTLSTRFMNICQRSFQSSKRLFVISAIIIFPISNYYQEYLLKKAFFLSLVEVFWISTVDSLPGTNLFGGCTAKTFFLGEFKCFQLRTFQLHAQVYTYRQGFSVSQHTMRLPLDTQVTHSADEPLDLHPIEVIAPVSSDKFASYICYLKDFHGFRNYLPS